MAVEVENAVVPSPSILSPPRERTVSPPEPAPDLYQQREAPDIHREAADAWREEPCELNENEIEAALRNALEHRHSRPGDEASCASQEGLDCKCEGGSSGTCACHLDPTAVMEAADRLVASSAAADEDPFTAVMWAAVNDPNVQNALLQSHSVRRALTAAQHNWDAACDLDVRPLVAAMEARSKQADEALGLAKPEKGVAPHLLPGLLRGIDAFCKSLPSPAPPVPWRSRFGVLQDPSERLRPADDDDGFAKMVVLVVAAILIAARVGRL